MGVGDLGEYGVHGVICERETIKHGRRLRPCLEFIGLLRSYSSHIYHSSIFKQMGLFEIG